MDLSAYRKKLTESDTHSLKMRGGGTCQDTEKSRLGEGHSLPGYDSGRDLSGHGNIL